MIDAPSKAFLEEYLPKTASREGVEVVASAILQTHVHLLLRLPPRSDLPRLVQLMKGGSSYAVSRLPGNIVGLRWAKEYSATSVSPGHLDKVKRYLANQALHHPGEEVRPKASTAPRATPG